ncbi:transcriptional regulator, XRE family [Pseudobacteroides cellulosolvens ATCC 35603 = DSM 2933]|uniref:Transcriptional regulator, XRE family n=1 Tax=Pseudobacteroides cellulosolvens ATCC 35603 = DSM 2933 TaxID=398512 RepID=A0A0L6JVC5_9FIRM|nr:transcriptional regulator, XRE family [Pseudobacteroides cellulosolvens ATCC 35603 = DSM 2933]
MYLKNRIKELREKFKLTQDELADKVDVSRQTIISLEKGKYNPSIMLAHKISQLFELTIEQVFIFDKEEEPENEK